MMVETRWNTLLNMLESTVAVLPEIIELLNEQGESCKLAGWDTDIATQLITLLTPFKDVSMELQAKKASTLHLVLIRYHDLIKHCAECDESDHPVRNTM